MNALTDEQARAVIEAVVFGAGARGASEDEIRLAVQWATSTLADFALLELVLERRLAVSRVEADGVTGPNLTFVTRGSRTSTGRTRDANAW